MVCLCLGCRLVFRRVGRVRLLFVLALFYFLLVVHFFVADTKLNVWVRSYGIIFVAVE